MLRDAGSAAVQHALLIGFAIVLASLVGWLGRMAAAGFSHAVFPHAALLPGG